MVDLFAFFNDILMDQFGSRESFPSSGASFSINGEKYLDLQDALGLNTSSV